MNEQELTKLWDIFHSIEDANLSVFASNAFVAGCFMHARGEEEAAVKLLTTIFNVIGWNNRSTLFNKVFKFLPSNEAKLAKIMPSNIELNKVTI